MVFPKKYVMYAIMFIIIFSLHIKPISAFSEPSVSAQAAILIERDTGRVLYSRNPDAKLPMASTTKIMTAICAIEEMGDNINKIIEISSNAAGVEGSSMYLQQGEKMTLKELLYGLMLSSGNDAAVAIAESTLENQERFVDMMNKKAYEIGAASTHFTNPNGLPDDNHYSTARDMAKITAYAMKNPVFSEIVATKNYKITGEGKAYPRVLSNHNKLLGMYEGCVGVKTGFTKAAGRCLVSGAERNGMVLIGVTLNAPDDWNDHKEMFDFGFSEYEYAKAASWDTPLCSAEVKGACAGAVPIYPKENVCLPLKKGEKFFYKVNICEELSAPLNNGEKVGTAIFEIRQEGNQESILKKEVELVVNADVERLSGAGKSGLNFKDSIDMVFEQWLRIFNK